MELLVLCTHVLPEAVENLRHVVVHRFLKSLQSKLVDYLPSTSIAELDLCYLCTRTMWKEAVRCGYDTLKEAKYTHSVAIGHYHHR